MYRHTLLAIVILASAIGTSASSEQRRGELTLKEDRQRTGSLLRRDVAWSTKIPLNRTYAQLSAEEKAVLHSHYELIGPNDEPPFPRDGLGPVVKVIRQGQQKRLARGELKMLVTVGPDGKAIKVSAQGTTDDVQMAKFVATVLKLTPYKPAICEGAPCTMQYPFYLKLDVDKASGLRQLGPDEITPAIR